MTPLAPSQPPSDRFFTSRHLAGVVIDRSRFDGPLYRGHLSEEFVLWQLLAGANEQWHERAVATIRPGTVQLINPGEFMRPIKRWTPATVDLAISIDGDVLAGAFEAASPRAGGRAPSFQVFQVRDEALLRTTRTFAAAVVDQQATLLEAQTGFAELVNAMVAHEGRLQPLKAAASPKILATRDYLREHFAEPVSLATLEELTGFTRFYIVRQFRAVFGAPPHAYQTHLRIMHACRLLCAGFPAAHVGVEVGFADQSHFYRHFKRQIGMTPLAFKKGLARGA